MKMGRFRPLSDSGSGLNTFFRSPTKVNTAEMDAFQLAADGQFIRGRKQDAVSGLLSFS
jgi:hypothetical protein